jgi:lipopolysaccharide/colanic/teichoic acid biosynthesis glycosyltransferase
VKRLLDIAVSLVALIVLSPAFLFAAIGIKWSSPGPIFYRAQRMARDRRRSLADAHAAYTGPERRCVGSYGGREFTMYKFRTMRPLSGGPSIAITAADDSRVYPFGALLRRTKIDELPQLLNVLKGEMTLVGPRPEAPEIVRSRYTQEDLTTLQVTPGLTSPGTLYYYTHCESALTGADVLEQYVNELLPAKLALDRVYLRRAGVLYDIRILLRTCAAIVVRLSGGTQFPDPPEVRELDVNQLTLFGSRLRSRGAEQIPQN